MLGAGETSELAGRVTLDVMFALLNNLLVGLNSPPPVHPVHYDGLEYRWSIFVFRPARPYSQASQPSPVNF